jgi:hypothetical protein
MRDECDASRDIARWTAEWQGRIAAAATGGEGLDTFRHALLAIKQSDLACELRAHAQVEVWEAALRHEVADLNVLAAIYTAVLSEQPPASEEELDEATLRDDERRGDAAEIERLSKLSPIEKTNPITRGAHSHRVGSAMAARPPPHHAMSSCHIWPSPSAPRVEGRS